MEAHNALRLIEDCYAAALDADRWPKVLDQISAALNARGTVIVSYDPARTATSLHSESLNEADEPYRNQWWRFDMQIARAKSLGIRPGTIISDPMILSSDEKRRDPFFQEFCAPHGLDELIAYFAADPMGGLMTFSAFRDAASGFFEAQQTEQLRVIGPHVTRAFQLTTTLATIRQNVGDLALGLETMRVGTLLLDQFGRVRHVSRSAEGMLTDCIRILPGRTIEAVAPGERSKLDRLVASLEPGNASPPHNAALIRAKDGRLRLFLQLVPLRTNMDFLDMIGAPLGGALLLLRAFTPRATASIAPHLEQLGLSPTEALVALEVGRGKPPRSVAEGMNISDNTVRAHLKSIFSKLEINRQSELAVIVTRLEAML